MEGPPAMAEAASLVVHASEDLSEVVRRMIADAPAGADTWTSPIDGNASCTRRSSPSEQRPPRRSTLRNDRHAPAIAEERTRFGRNGIYDVTVRRGEETIAEFRGRSRTVARPADRPRPSGSA